MTVGSATQEVIPWPRPQQGAHPVDEVRTLEDRARRLDDHRTGARPVHQRVDQGQQLRQCPDAVHHAVEGGELVGADRVERRVGGRVGRRVEGRCHG
jgi:hypothetical protein